MNDLLRRAYRAADAPDLAELLNLVDAHAGGQRGSTADEVHGLITALVRDPVEDSTVVRTADGTLVAAGFTTTPPAGGFRLYLTGGVHPLWQGRGLGGELLTRHLDRAVRIHRERAPEATWQAEVPRTPVDNERALRLFRRHGLTPVRYWFEMVASTSPVSRPTPASALDGLRLVPYSAEHERAVHAAHQEAFAGNWGFQRRDLAGWADLTVRSAGFLPALSLVVLDGAEPAGYLLSYDHAAAGRISVGQLGVRPRWRRRGLAGTMLAWLLDAAGRGGHKQVGLSVDAANPGGAVAVYERAGFTAEFRAVTHTRTLAPAPD